MSRKDPNPVSSKRPKRVAVVISNPAVSATTGWSVGFWWSELTHPYFALTERGYKVEIFNPQGGRCKADAMSNPRDPSGYSSSDLISMSFIATPRLAALVEDTKPVGELDVTRFDAIVVAGGRDNGSPGPCPNYGPTYHAAFALDPVSTPTRRPDP